MRVIFEVSKHETHNKSTFWSSRRDSCSKKNQNFDFQKLQRS